MAMRVNVIVNPEVQFDNTTKLFLREAIRNQMVNDIFEKMFIEAGLPRSSLERPDLRFMVAITYVDHSRSFTLANLIFC